jgi:hypothetical protein
MREGEEGSGPEYRTVGPRIRFSRPHETAAGTHGRQEWERPPNRVSLGSSPRKCSGIDRPAGGGEAPAGMEWVKIIKRLEREAEMELERLEA